MMRLDRFLSETTPLTRSLAKRALKNGEVTLNGEPIKQSATQIDTDNDVVVLDGEETLTQPATLRLLSPTQAELTISEGRYHQVKRMFAALGNHVNSLHRSAIGDLSLDENLAPGEWRELTADEIARF